MIKFTVDSKSFKQKLNDMKKKAKSETQKTHRQMVDLMLNDLRVVSHFDTGELSQSWDNIGQQFKDNVFTDTCYSAVVQAYYEKLRGLPHDTVALAKESFMIEIESLLYDLADRIIK